MLEQNKLANIIGLYSVAQCSAPRRVFESQFLSILGPYIREASTTFDVNETELTTEAYEAHLEFLADPNLKLPIALASIDNKNSQESDLFKSLCSVFKKFGPYKTEMKLIMETFEKHIEE